MTAHLTRRFFVTSGLSAAGGLIIAVSTPALADVTPLLAEPWSGESPERASGEINAFVVVEPDNSILLRIANPMPGGHPVAFANAEMSTVLPGWLTLTLDAPE